MPVDLFGPADAGAVRAVTTRPAETADTVALDSFFQPCLGGPGTGTPITDVWLNRVTAMLRSLARRSGVVETNADDDILSRAVRSQRLNFFPSGAIAGTANAPVIAPVPAPASLAELGGAPMRVRMPGVNTGAMTLGVTLANGTTAFAPLRRAAGEEMSPGDVGAGRWVTCMYDPVALAWSALTLPQATRLLTPLTVYVRADGDDAHTGLADTAAAAFRTLQGAASAVRTRYDQTGQLVTFMVGAGTFEGVSFDSWAGAVAVQGASAATTWINTTPAQSGLLARRGSNITISNVRMVGAGIGLEASNGGNITFNSVEFANTGTHMSASWGGLIQIAAGGGYTILAGATNHVFAMAATIYLRGGYINIPAAVGFTTFAVAQHNGNLICGGGFAIGGAGAASCTGARYAAVTNGVLDLAGAGATYLPGNAAGSTASGGQYV